MDADQKTIARLKFILLSLMMILFTGCVQAEQGTFLIATSTAPSKQTPTQPARPSPTASSKVKSIINLNYALSPADYGLTNTGLYCVTWSPDGRKIATGDRLGSLIVWDPIAGNLIHHLSGDRITLDCDWSGDGSVLVNASGPDIWTWDPEAGAPILRMRGIGGRIKGVRVSPDSSKVATWALYEKSGRIWALDSGEHLFALPHMAELIELAWSPDSSTVASAVNGPRAQVWDVSDGQVIAALEHDGNVNDLAWSPDGSLLAVGHDSGLSIWDPRKWDDGKPMTLDVDRGSYIAWSPDGSRIAVVTDALFSAQVEIWEVETQSRLYDLVSPSATLFDIAWSPDGRWLAAGFNNHMVAIWDMDTGEWSGVARHEAEDINKVAWSPDSRTLASVDAKGNLFLWRISD